MCTGRECQQMGHTAGPGCHLRPQRVTFCRFLGLSMNTDPSLRPLSLSACEPQCHQIPASCPLKAGGRVGTAHLIPVELQSQGWGDLASPVWLSPGTPR